MLLRSLLLLAGAQSAFAKCKCSPTDDCWPSADTWNALNSSVNGKLARNEPIARPCYHGPGYSSELCQDISSNWTNNEYLATFPVGYSYPLVESCPPVNAMLAGYPQCDLGNYPVYSVKATTAADVAAGIKFARDHNVRLVIKNTGHDISQRSQGYGSLSIWIKSIKDGLHFHDGYVPGNGSCASNWTGSAITVGGGYVWEDVYDFAAKHNVIAVGGADPTVGVLGGFMQGGGHGPVSHFFGLGADQVLEYNVVLASGQLVTANACQYTDLFTALRGGGGGTYGVVLSATIKAHPTRPVLGHNLDVIALHGNDDAVLTATGNIMSKLPAISDAGYSGTAILSAIAGPLVYTHPFLNLLDNNSTETLESAKNAMNRLILDDLLPHNGTSYLVLSTFTSYPSFHAYYSSTHHTTPGSNRPIMASWLFDRQTLESPDKNLTSLLETVTTETVRNSTLWATLFNIVAGGKVLEPVPHTSVNPAWRSSHLLFQQIDAWPDNAGTEEIQQYRSDLTNIKLKAMKDMAPGMGTYLNEADPYDPDWRKDWFGDKYDWLASVKKKYDPENVFWCWRCVGNEGWQEVTGGAWFGPLCETGK
ncbi:FAD-binding domain-containing protein [Aspergillus welwitschiae]|uniref:FAD-binding domain-containing protein n=1 Tax=Aspergillus welwitschiae TaxID=1341132 RepID=A0A3F3PZP7_9EURO|nr:FAD-binding domain-containing protein [Aspergillus welwitschiae]RDH32388.1 FAD-binding domain-containing protein [Aspergillus welwitschiae]